MEGLILSPNPIFRMVIVGRPLIHSILPIVHAPLVRLFLFPHADPLSSLESPFRLLGEEGTELKAERMGCLLSRRHLRLFRPLPTYPTDRSGGEKSWRASALPLAVSIRGAY